MRPIWTGTISFGLLNIPVSLMAGERSMDLQFRMLDSRDKSPVRYERVNAESGEEVPWKDIVKAFEYDKGNYVVLEDEDFQQAASEGRETVEISGFVAESEIDTRYFEKPYVLVPGKKAEKGYVLLRDTLAELGKVGIARVVVRTREYLCMVKPLEQALLLILLRFPQELVDLHDYRLPEGKSADFRVQKAELAMASELIESMSIPWKADDYKDEYRDRLKKIIEQRIKKAGSTASIAEPEREPEEGDATNVVDFTALLKKSLASNRRTPAKSKTESGKSAKRSSSKKPAAKKAAAKKTSSKKKASAKSKAASSGRKGSKKATA